MNKKEIWKEIELYIRTDKKNNPYWPDHAAAQAGKVTGECGKLIDAAMNMKYENKEMQPVYRNLMEYYAIRTAALSIRLLENLKEKANSES